MAAQAAAAGLQAMFLWQAFRQQLAQPALAKRVTLISQVTLINLFRLITVPEVASASGLQSALATCRQFMARAMFRQGMATVQVTALARTTTTVVAAVLFRRAMARICSATQLAPSSVNARPTTPVAALGTAFQHQVRLTASALTSELLIRAT